MTELTKSTEEALLRAVRLLVEYNRLLELVVEAARVMVSKGYAEPEFDALLDYVARLKRRNDL